MDARAALRDEIEARGLTQKDAARLIGTTQPSVCRWLRGQYPTPPMVVLALRATRPSKDARKTARAARRKDKQPKH